MLMGGLNHTETAYQADVTTIIETLDAYERAVT